MDFLQRVFVCLIAIFVALFFGFGIAAFYSPPKAPEPVKFPKPPPSVAVPPGPTIAPDRTYYESPAYQEYQEKLNEAEEQSRRQQESYREATRTYGRSVFFIATACGLIVIVTSVFLPATLNIIRFGLLLGGTLTVLYGVVRHFNEMDDKMRFAVVAVGLAALLYVAYRRLAYRKAGGP